MDEINGVIFNNCVDSLNFLTESGIELINESFTGSIYDFIASRLHILNSDAYIVVNSFDNENMKLKTEAVTGVDNRLSKVINLLGFHPVGKEYEFKDSINNQFSDLDVLKDGYVKEFMYGLYELSFEKIPKIVSASIERILDIKKIYGVAFIVDEKIYANAIVILPGGSDFKYRDLINAFSRTVSIFFKKLANDKKLQENEVKYKTIIDSISDVIWIYNITLKKFTFVSPSVYKLRGYTSEEVMQNDIFDGLPSEYYEVISSNMKKRLDRYEAGEDIFNESFRYEIEQPHKKGVNVWTEVSVRYHKNDEGQIELIGVSRGVSDRKAMEFSLQKKNNELQKATDMTNRFFSIISHDLRNPFHALLGFNTLQEKALLDGDYREAMDYNNVITEVLQSTYDLLDNLLQWSKSKMGNIKYNPEDLSIDDEIEHILDLIEHAAKQKNIRIIIAKSDEINVFIDQNMLRCVIRNLLTNAVKFTPVGGEIYIRKESSDFDITLSIEDDGVGMSESEVRMLFDSDKNFTNLGTNNEKGTGLGLSLCKSFVDKWGGRIWCESKKGKGSKFYFTIPRL